MWGYWAGFAGGGGRPWRYSSGLDKLIPIIRVYCSMGGGRCTLAVCEREFDFFVMCHYNRPLAKLDKAVKVADASNQRKAKCKTISAIAVALREDTKSFDKADSVFNKDTFL